jgi:hypothetical protein
MNRVPLERRIQIINCLVEGNSIRSTDRMTETHRATMMRRLVEVGEGCATLMDRRMQSLTCRRIQVDEIWTYVGRKQRWVDRPFIGARRTCGGNFKLGHYPEQRYVDNVSPMRDNADLYGR